MDFSSRSSSRHSSQPSYSSSSSSLKSLGRSSQSSSSSAGNGLYHQLDPMVIPCSDTNIAQLGIRFLPLAAMDEAITAEIDMAGIDAPRPVWRRLFKGQPSWHNLVKDGRYNQAGEPVTRVLGILGLRDKEEDIRDLLDEGLADSHLPLGKSHRKEDFGTLISCQGKKFKSFSTWKDSDINGLLRQQYEVLAPEFTARGVHISIDGHIPLPVYDIKDLSPSNTRTIYKARLHAAHLMPKVKDNPQVAIKCFSLEKDFEKEKENLIVLQNLNHPHLIRHLATVKHGDLFYAILYWADGGNLYDFWKSNPDAFPTQRPGMFKWCFQQMFGLVDALFVLHEAKYRHGDLKPENIFHFRNSDDPDIPQGGYGRFVIADVGISKFHHQATELRHSGTDTKATTLCYRAPEAQRDEDKPGQAKPRSRKYDIWSVGCIFMEIVIWLLYDHKTIDVFREIRRGHDEKAAYYKCIGGHVEFHPAVSEGLKALRSDPRCAKGTGLADLIDLIANKLIVILPEKRATAKELRDEFKKILEKADRGFSTKIVEPRPRIPNAFTPG
ncbi:kinase-like protein [Xylaria digitata]|nr:kinase-like protein [Xylaria digitata]